MNAPWGLISIARLQPVFVLLRGVVHGCPPAVVSFVVPVDQILRRIVVLMVDCVRGVIRACADVIGLSLSSIAALPESAVVVDLLS